MNPNNAYEVYILYREHLLATQPFPKALDDWRKFKAVILRFVLQEFGFERVDPSARMTAAELEAAEEYLKTVAMRSLLRIQSATADALEKLGVSQSSRGPYTSHVKGFVEWGEKQVWWPNNRGKNGTFHDQQRCPPRRTSGKVSPPKLIAGKGKTKQYALKEGELPKPLRAQMRTMRTFFIEPNNPQRSFGRIEESTMKGHNKNTLCILGWFHRRRIQSIPLQELSLDLIFPVFDEEFLESMSEKEQKKFWREQKAKLKAWLCDYRTFLQQTQHSYSPCTWLSKLEAVLAVARFQWAPHVEHKSDYENIPLMAQLREELDAVQEELDEWNDSGRYAADQTLKWPDEIEGKSALEVIQETVVEKLRLKCNPRTAVRGRIRTPHSVAVCHQRLLMWVKNALIPSPRQQVPRTEQVATSCPIKRPKDVPIDGLYQPLPPDTVLPKRHNGTVKANFLCRLYSYKGKKYPEGVWIRVIRDYKTWKTHGDQEYIIPNWPFEDGSHLYDYIEQFLYGYWLPGSFKGSQVYTWGQADRDGQLGKWISKGRAEFNPIDCCALEPSEGAHWTWGNLFVMTTKGLPFSDVDFADFFAQGSLTAIEKWITPHILRSVWANWGYEQGLSDAELRSLAYSMGMTLETLRRTYERCTTAEKRKAIEMAVKERMINSKDAEVVSVEKLVRLSRQLNLADRQKLAASLLETTG